ncbi:MAG: dihydropteroate synthase [Elusimicrobiota bacterium]
MFNFFQKKIICGILNITPDSFSDGGLYNTLPKALKRAEEMIDEGASWIDIGGQSSRPFSEPISEEEELNRILPVISGVKKLKKDIIISVDTYYPVVADRAIEAGADIINDITGVRNQNMADIILKRRKPVVIMHMKGTPRDMQVNPYYDDLIGEIYEFFYDRIRFLNSKGFRDIILDPGIGFGKTVEHNILILKNLKQFRRLGYPIMIGPSRKSFIGSICGEKDPKKRVSGTIATCLFCYDSADIFRVHDVYDLRQAFSIFEELKK